MPEYEPRGCPRGAAFSWYTYSPTRIRYPYVRSVPGTSVWSPKTCGEAGGRSAYQS